jgi:methionyl aminopeptidase
MLEHAIAAAAPGRRWSSIARELEAIATQANFAIAVDFVGHGIGRKLHEPPQVPCSAYRSFCEHGDFTLRPGMVLAIEPMLVLETPQRIAAGEAAGDLCSPACTLAADGWTVILNSGRPSCHVEHTVVITRDGARVLTAGSRYTGFADYRRAG